MTKEELIKGTNTRQLMKWRELAYKIGGGEGYNPIDSYGGKGEFYFTLSEILTELNTREHVPNKMEARAIRQARAKKGI